KIKEQVQNLPDLEIPSENAHIILETDGCIEGWGGIVKWKKSKEDPRSLERICAYASGKFSTTQSTINAEINACINTLEKLKIYYLDKQEVTLRTDCQAIISFYNKTNSNKSSRVRWIKFADAVTGTGVKINIEHIEGKHNTLADSLSRLVNLCFAECTGEMKELAAAALYSVEEVLQSPNAFQKNMKTTCEEVMKISNHFLESSQKLSSHLKNQEHCKTPELRPGCLALNDSSIFLDKEGGSLARSFSVVEGKYNLPDTKMKITLPGIFILY
ncbi:putative polyprotein, partial [Tanacetum coccineum]